jgi:TusA-related sulfurtransferase
MGMNIKISEAVVVDTGTKRCPFVLLSLRKALKTGEVGQLFAVRTIDPQAIADIRAFCQASSQSFEGAETSGQGATIYVRKVKMAA